MLDGINEDRNLGKSPDVQREIPPFPAGAVVLKTAWQVVYARKGNRTGPLYVWNAELWKVMKASGKNQSKDPSRFGSSVTIDTTPGRECKDTDYGSLVPLSCFFYYKIKGKQDLQSLQTSLAVFVGTEGPGAGAENAYLVLVAIHITTKEIPDWVWATFWWNNSATRDPFVVLPAETRLPNSV